MSSFLNRHSLLSAVSALQIFQDEAHPNPHSLRDREGLSLFGILLLFFRFPFFLTILCSSFTFLTISFASSIFLLKNQEFQTLQRRPWVTDCSSSGFSGPCTISVRESFSSLFDLRG
jgi:hypothetical protein